MADGGIPASAPDHEFAHKRSAHLSPPLEPRPSSRQRQHGYTRTPRIPPSTVSRSEYSLMGSTAPSYPEHTLGEGVTNSEKWLDESSRNVSGSNGLLLSNCKCMVCAILVEIAMTDAQ